MTKFRCPKCNSLRVFQYISVGAKQKMNNDSKIYDVGNGGIDNVFDTCGCEKCGWDGNYMELKETKK